MRKILKKTLFTFYLSSLMFNFLQASSFEDHKKAQMIQDLEFIKHNLEAGYAPIEWKKDHTGWDLNEAFECSKNKILAIPSITTKQFQHILRDFAKTMKDYHVDISFFSSEFASLPFSIKGAEGRYFIDWIDPLCLPTSHYNIHTGDELLEFDERPIKEVIAELVQFAGKASNLNTDLRLAEMKLTLRNGATGDTVPKGSVMVTTRSAKTGKINIRQLHWTHTPEQIKNPLDFLQAVESISSFLPKFKTKPKIELPEIMMVNPIHQTLAEKYTDREGSLGSRKSFIPDLGEITWSSEENENYWYAYIYCNPQGQNIGYIRIPDYLGSTTEANEFGKIINLMEEQTEALIIDQLHNFGGFVRLQHLITSMLTNYPLITPYHRIKITQKEAFKAYQTLEKIRLIDLMSLLEISSNEEKENQEKEGEERLNYQEILFVKDYSELILEDWNKGLCLTRPTPILGADKINPHPKYQYSKPLLVLIDEMSLSGCELMAATLRDNERALLFGARTAGAGGYVFKFQFPNHHGIAECSYTASIVERPNAQKIENLGVTPDIEYRVTPEDIQDGYKGYREAVNQAIQILLEEQPRHVRIGN